MDPSAFTQTREVVDAIAGLQKSCGRKEFSDIVDDQGYQYVDLVMAGGGLLGIAIVGYIYALESVGIRFLRIGGTSAGSITALLLAALDEMENAKAEKLVGILSEMDTWSFVDGGPAAQDLVRDWVGDGGRWAIAFQAARVLPRVWSKGGLNPGRKFLEWLEGVLASHGIETTAQLRERMRRIPPGLRSKGQPLPPGVIPPDLALVTADITTETKVDFPRMAPLYWADWERLNPSIFVRASMSIPFFFDPMIVTDVPQGVGPKKEWERLASYGGNPPPQCAFIDGGIMSNFPIELFHVPDAVPAAPTFGIALGSQDRTPNTFANPWQLATAIFDSARHCLDYDFIAKNPDYKNLVGYIDPDGFNWLDFGMPDQRKVELFARGVHAARSFLETFDWPKYKAIRDHLARAHQTESGQLPPDGRAPSPCDASRDRAARLDSVEIPR